MTLTTADPDQSPTEQIVILFNSEVKTKTTYCITLATVISQTTNRLYCLLLQEMAGGWAANQGDKARVRGKKEVEAA